jgi:hypothetical protein
MTELSIDIEVGSVRGIPVSVTAVDAVLLIGSGTLMGWSLRDASSDVPTSVEGSVTSPGAGATIATTAASAAGTYLVNWSTELTGAAAAADANNFEVTDNAGVVLVSLNGGVAASFPQPQVEVTIPQGSVVAVKAIGAGTAGVTYGAQLSLEPVAAGNYIAELRDGGQPLGEVSSAASGVDSVWFGPMGVRISNGITLHVISGTLTGVVYAGFDK